MAGLLAPRKHCNAFTTHPGGGPDGIVSAWVSRERGNYAEKGGDPFLHGSAIGNVVSVSLSQGSPYIIIAAAISALLRNAACGGMAAIHSD